MKRNTIGFRIEWDGNYYNVVYNYCMSAGETARKVAATGWKFLKHTDETTHFRFVEKNA